MVFQRRSFLKLITAVPLAAAAVLLAARAAKAGSISKKDAEYQDNPKPFQRCSACRFWVMGHTAAGQGTCRIVNGPINPNGWCKYFQPLPVY